MPPNPHTLASNFAVMKSWAAESQPSLTALTIKLLQQFLQISRGRYSQARQRNSQARQSAVSLKLYCTLLHQKNSFELRYTEPQHVCTSHVYEPSVPTVPWRVTSPSIRVTPIVSLSQIGPWCPAGPWRVALVVCGSMTTQMDRSTCLKQNMYAMDVVALGTMRSHCVTSGLPCRSAGTKHWHCAWGRGEQRCHCVCRNMPSVHLAIDSIVQAHFPARYMGVDGLLPIMTYLCSWSTAWWK